MNLNKMYYALKDETKIGSYEAFLIQKQTFLFFSKLQNILK